jgi:hypothetical protein
MLTIISRDETLQFHIVTSVKRQYMMGELVEMWCMDPSCSVPTALIIRVLSLPEYVLLEQAEKCRIAHLA